MSSDSQSAEAAPQTALPLFYQKPELLRADLHGNMRLSSKPDFRFASATNAVPVMVSEFGAASRFYPVVFVGAPAVPVAVLGLERTNLFVDDKGEWDGLRTYIPAYVRRYPFTFINQQGAVALGIDTACERLIPGGKGYKAAQPLFQEGNPTALTQEALRFCGALQTDNAATQAFAAALTGQDLLIDQHAQAASENGRRYDVHGFRIIDARKFQALPDPVVLDWHRKGWLALAHAHFASLACWKDLIDRTGARETVSAEDV